MLVELITPDKVVFSGEAESVKLPGTSGQFEALNNHAPVISSLEAGTVVVKTAEGSQDFEINGGIVEILNNKIIVLA